MNVELLVDRRTAQVTVDDQRFLALIAVSDGKVDGRGRLTFSRGCARDKNRPKPAVKIAQQDRVTQCADRLFVRRDRLVTVARLGTGVLHDAVHHLRKSGVTNQALNVLDAWERP